MQGKDTPSSGVGSVKLVQVISQYTSFKSLGNCEHVEWSNGFCVALSVVQALVAARCCVTSAGCPMLASSCCSCTHAARSDAC